MAEIVSVSPELSGSIQLYPWEGQFLMFSPAFEDGGKVFNVKLRMEDEGITYDCELNLYTDWEIPAEPFYQVRIDFVEDVIQGREQSVDVFLDSANTELGGFDFRRSAGGHEE